MNRQVGAGIGIAIAGTIMTVITLVIGLRLAEPFVSSVNEQGQAISCFDSNDIPISGAQFDGSISPPTQATAAASSTSPALSSLPRKVTGLKGAVRFADDDAAANAVAGGSIVCGAGGKSAKYTSAAGVKTWTKTEATFTNAGTIRYDLEVYDADSFAGLSVMLFVLVLLVMFIGSIAGGGLMAASGLRNR